MQVIVFPEPDIRLHTDVIPASGFSPNHFLPQFRRKNAYILESPKHEKQLIFSPKCTLILTHLGIFPPFTA